MLIKWKHELILDLCKNKKILHIWCTDSPLTKERARKNKLLHQKLMKVTKNIDWLDYSRDDILYLKKEYNINYIYWWDIIKWEYEIKLENTYDYIIFWDVIEHLENPWLALENIKKIMWKNTKLILTTPNVFQYKNILTYITWKEHVHPDHVFWPSKKTLDVLIWKCWFKIQHFEYCFEKHSKIYSLKWKIFFNLILKYRKDLLPTMYYELSK